MSVKTTCLELFPPAMGTRIVVEQPPLTTLPDTHATYKTTKWLKGQCNKIFDLWLFSSIEPVWAYEQNVFAELFEHFEIFLVSTTPTLGNQSFRT